MTPTEVVSAPGETDAILAVGGHTVTWTINEWGPEASFACYHPPGAECKVTCPEGCEQWVIGEHEHVLDAVDECNALVFFDAAEGDTFGYAGPRAPLVSGPIEIEWDGDAYTWKLPVVTSPLPEVGEEEVKVKPDLKRLPTWADEWAEGARCGCGARAVYCYGYGGRHTVCSRSSWGIEKCPEPKP